MADAIKVPDLYKMRRAMRAVGKDALREVQGVTKRAAEVVAVQAGRNQPRGTRPLSDSYRGRKQRLADSYRASTSGARGLVRSKLLHGPIEEYRRGGPHAVNRALDAKQDEIADDLERSFDELMRRHGFRGGPAA